jgi:uncharacterized membrane protein YcaP (DUF421 family)
MHTLLATPLWTNLFGLKISLAEKILRPVLVYCFLVVMLRIFGKRELAQLNPFDLVVLLSLSNTVQNAIIGDDNTLAGGIIGAFSLLAMNYLVIRFLFKHRRLDEVFEGDPTPLIKDGCVMRRNLASELLTESELLAVAHRQGFASLQEIEECTLEPGGVFYIKPKKPSEEESRHTELLSRLDQLSRQVAALQNAAHNG